MTMTLAQRHLLNARHASSRAIFNTPALKQFKRRGDVLVLEKPDVVHVFVSNRRFSAPTELEALEAAMRAEVQ